MPKRDPTAQSGERNRDFEVLDRMADAFKDVPFEEIEREAAKALAEVRAGRRSRSAAVG